MKPGSAAYAFKGRRGFPSPIIAQALVDKGAIGFGGENVVEFRVNGAGAVYAASAAQGTPDVFDQNTPTSIYVSGTENYDGLRRVYNIRAGRFVQIYAPYVAETPASGFCHVGYKAEVASEFVGFSVSFLAAPAVPLDLEITLHSAKGSAYNSLIWSKDMNGVQDDSYTFNPPIFLRKGDRLDLTLLSGDFGTIFHIRKLA